MEYITTIGHILAVPLMVHLISLKIKEYKRDKDGSAIAWIVICSLTALWNMADAFISLMNAV